MFTDALRSFFKIFRKKDKPPEFEKTYTIPPLECSYKILLSGPAYNDKTFFGSFLLDSVAVREWVSDHSISVWSSAKLEQQARLYLPTWLENVSFEQDGKAVGKSITIK